MRPIVTPADTRGRCQRMTVDSDAPMSRSRVGLDHSLPAELLPRCTNWASGVNQIRHPSLRARQQMSISSA